MPVAIAERVACCSTKASVAGLTQSLAVEWAPKGIRVNAVAPACTRTRMVSDLVDQGKVDIDRVLARTPLGRMTEPAEVANVIAFLCSDLAPAIVGEVIGVDSGWNAFVGSRHLEHCPTTPNTLLEPTMSDRSGTRKHFLNALNRIADGEGTTEEQTARLRAALLEFGSETPDNINCAERIEVGSAGRAAGLTVRDSGMFLADIAHMLENEPMPAALANAFPHISEDDWDTFTRLTTLIYSLLNRDTPDDR